jgi:hypothetical protein
MLLSLRSVYHNLRLVDHVDDVTSATYRQQAQEVLSDLDVSLVWRQAIADRLNTVNQWLGMQVDREGSY